VRHWNNDGVVEDIATGSAAGTIAPIGCGTAWPNLEKCLSSNKGGSPVGLARCACERTARLARSITSMWRGCSDGRPRNAGSQSVIARTWGGKVPLEYGPGFRVVLDGVLRIDFRDGAVRVSAGEMFVVPKCVEHKPYAESEVRLLLIEPRVF